MLGRLVDPGRPLSTPPHRTLGGGAAPQPHQNSKKSAMLNATRLQRRRVSFSCLAGRNKHFRTGETRIRSGKQQRRQQRRQRKKQRRTRKNITANRTGKSVPKGSRWIWKQRQPYHQTKPRSEQLIFQYTEGRSEVGSTFGSVQALCPNYLGTAPLPHMTNTNTIISILKLVKETALEQF